ncbi:MAG: hypothetical protein ABJN40_10760 [Sneathiella sp.]
MSSEFSNTAELRMTRHFRSLSSPPFSSLTLDMFVEDVPLSIVPIRGRTRRNEKFSITLHGDEQSQKAALSVLSSLARNDEDNLVGLTCEAIENIATLLAWDGCAYYELFSTKDNLLNLSNFTSKRLFRVPFYYLQIVPKGHWEDIGRKVNIIRSSEVWQITMPRQLGGKKRYKTTLKNLERFGSSAPEFWLENMQSGFSSHFNFGDFVKETNIYHEKATKIWGWNRRDSGNEYFTEFYSFYSMVTFRWAQSIMRDHILNEINTLFSRLKITSRLNISGLPSPNDYLQLREELSEGKKSFKEVTEVIWK